MGNILELLRVCSTGDTQDLVFLDFEGFQSAYSGESKVAELSDTTIKFIENLELINGFMRSHLNSTTKPSPQEISKEHTIKCFGKSEETQFDPIPRLVVDAEKQEEMSQKIIWLHKCMKINNEMSEVMPEIFNKIAEAGPQIREDNIYLIVFGKILDLSMQFDDLKLQAMDLQNMISLMKRGETRNTELQTFLKNEGINLSLLSQFYIKPAPMLTGIIDAASQFFNRPDQNVPLDVIVNYCKTCMGILTSELRNRFQLTGTVGQVMRIMVASALLYDHLSDIGIFVESSPIQVKKIVKILESEMKDSFWFGNKKAAESQSEAKNLLNCLKYSNKHLKDSSSGSIQNLLAKVY